MTLRENHTFVVAGVNDGRTGVVVKYFIVALRDYAANQTKKTLAPLEFADDVEGLTA